MKKGLFITFEGGEGAGKSIQVKILSKRLRTMGYLVTVTREPGGTSIGEQIREITNNPKNTRLDFRAEAYLMAAARAQHVAEKILPALESGRLVISDRYVDSSIAYQGFGRNLGASVIEKLNELAVDGAVPHLTILLDITLEEGNQRCFASKTKDRFDFQKKGFYRRVREGYLTLAKKNPNRYVIIDAAKSIDEVAASVWIFVKKILDAWNGKKN